MRTDRSSTSHISSAMHTRGRAQPLGSAYTGDPRATQTKQLACTDRHHLPEESRGTT